MEQNKNRSDSSKSPLAENMRVWPPNPAHLRKEAAILPLSGRQDKKAESLPTRQSEKAADGDKKKAEAIEFKMAHSEKKTGESFFAEKPKRTKAEKAALSEQKEKKKRRRAYRRRIRRGKNHLREDARKASCLGISYGQYQWQKLEKKKESA